MNKKCNHKNYVYCPWCDPDWIWNTDKEKEDAVKKAVKREETPSALEKACDGHKKESPKEVRGK